MPIGTMDDARGRGRARANAFGAGLLMALCGACGGGGGASGSGAAALPAQTVTTLSLLAGSAPDSGSVDGSGAAARFNHPTGVAVDGAGNVLVADSGNCEIRKITPAGAVSTLAGSAQHCASVDGSGAAAGFGNLNAVAASADGTVYAADGLQIRKISAAGAVSTFATLETGSMIAAVDAPYFYAAGIALDGAGNVYVTNGVGTRKISPAGAVTILDGVAGLDSLGNVWGSHAFMQRALAVDANGALWVADAAYTISRIDASGKKTLIAGLSGAPGYKDDNGAVARFGQVVGLAPDGSGGVYAGDAGNSLVRRVTTIGDTTTVAGTQGATVLQLGTAPGALPALAGLAADGKGDLFVIAGNAVVKIALH